ncbi:T9SS type A sorting domain-containing protein [bacterium]|nr:T9SS type A sorting domain-containing protein [bacterium]
MELSKRLAPLAICVFTLYCTVKVFSQENFWEPTAGPSYSPPWEAVHALIVGSNGLVYAGLFDSGTVGNGIYRSIDYGETWKPTSLYRANVWTLANNAFDNIFAGTSIGIYRSTDDGGTWKQVKIGTLIFCLAVDSSNHIFAAGESAFFCSTDNGETWTRSTTPLPGRSQCLAINFQGHILLGTDSKGVFRSIDQGQTWAAINAGLTKDKVFALATSNNGRIFAGTDGLIYNSIDNGDTWHASSNGLPNVEFRSLASHSDGHIFAGTNGSGVFRSTDNGNSWMAINDGLGSSRIQTLATDSHFLFAGTPDSGVFRSTNNGDTWKQGRIGLESLPVYTLASNAAGYLFAGTDITNRLYRSTDRGESWAPIGPTSTGIFAVATNAQGYLFAAFSYSFGDAGYATLNRSTDNGQTWNQVLQVGTWPSGRIFDVVCGSEGEVLVSTSDRGILRSDDYGRQWKDIGLNSFIVNQSALNSDGHIYAGTDSGAFRSTDKGENWIAINTGLTSGPIGSLQVNSAGQIFASTSAGIFTTIDNGETWSHTGLAEGGVIAINPSTGDVFVGSEQNGIFRSTNNGRDWLQINTGLSTKRVSSFTFSSVGRVFAGTSLGVHRSVQPLTAIKNVNSEIPRLISLEQSHPNPFNPITTIAFELPEDGAAQLTIFNAMGQQVIVLVDQAMRAGRHEVNFDASTLATGVYFYRLRFGEQVLTKRMLFAK